MTVAMQAQDGFGRYGKLIVTGLINPEDNEASEKKAEQLALESRLLLWTRPFIQDGSL